MAGPALTSVWRQLYDNPVAALELEVRSQLLMELQELLPIAGRDGLSIADISDSDLAAVRLGHLDLLQLQDLVRIAAQMRCRIRLHLEGVAPDAQ